jgi:hypothetical protein
LEEFLRRVRLRRYLAITKDDPLSKLSDTIPDWEKKTERLAELTEWCHKAARQLERENARPDDPRWETYNKYEQEARRIEKEIEELEQIQEAALTHLAETRGPIVLEMEDGTLRTLAASPGDRGDGEPLLPRDFLAVWRIAKVFDGSVCLGGVPTKLEFGNPGQISTVRLSAKEKRQPKKDAIVSEDGSLFGKA